MSIENMLQRPGTYSEDRLAILILLDQVDEENRRLREEQAVLKEKQNKMKMDLDAAHGQGRALKVGMEKLSKDVTVLKIRAGYIAASSGFLVALVFELVRVFLHK